MFHSADGDMLPTPIAPPNNTICSMCAFTSGYITSNSAMFVKEAVPMIVTLDGCDAIVSYMKFTAFASTGAKMSCCVKGTSYFYVRKRYSLTFKATFTMNVATII